METKYDVIILGGGPAGLTSAIYCARYGLKTILVSRDIGGTAKLAHKIENYPGFDKISGQDLIKTFEEQLKKNNVEITPGEVLKIEKYSGQ